MLQLVLNYKVNMADIGFLSQSIDIVKGEA